MQTISIKTLLETGAHFGHITPKKNPNMDKYIFGAKNGVNIIDLRQTLKQLQEAYDFITSIGQQGGKILFVGTKRITSDIIKKKAVESGNFYVNVRWLGGTLTNFNTVKQSIIKLKNVEKLAGEDLSYPGIIKKEASLLEKQRQKLSAILDGIRNMRKMPAAVVIGDINLDKIAIYECKTLGIPIIAVNDSNTNPLLVDYPIAANDDSIETIEMIMEVLKIGFMNGHHLYLTTDKNKPEAGSAKDSKTKNTASKLKKNTKELPKAADTAAQETADTATATKNEELPKVAQTADTATQETTDTAAKTKSNDTKQDASKQPSAKASDDDEYLDDDDLGELEDDLEQEILEEDKQDLIDDDNESLKDDDSDKK